MKIENRKAKFNYELGDSFEAGIALTGSEAKAVRSGRASINEAYAKVKNGEVYLINANINTNDDSATRSRRLLLHKSQIRKIEAKIKSSGLTLVPLSLYTMGRLIKVEIALARGRKEYSKRELLKKRDIKRNTERELSLKD